jgi:hypothetical protein
MAWLEDDRQEIVASSYHRTHQEAESAAPYLRRPPRGLFRPVNMAPTEGWQQNDTCADCGAPARDHDQATGECLPLNPRNT